jgi:hypothetical protein
MEFRSRGIYEAQEDMPSTKNRKQVAIFGKFQISVTIREKETARTLEHYLFA